MSVQDFVKGANQLQSHQVALSAVGGCRSKATATEIEKTARHVPSGQFHVSGSHIEHAHGYGISRSNSGKFLVTEADDHGNLRVHSSHDTIDDARTAALRRRIAAH